MLKPQAADEGMDSIEVPYRSVLYVASRVITSQRAPAGETSTAQVSYFAPQVELLYHVQS